MDKDETVVYLMQQEAHHKSLVTQMDAELRNLLEKLGRIRQLKMMVVSGVVTPEQALEQLK